VDAIASWVTDLSQACPGGTTAGADKARRSTPALLGGHWEAALRGEQAFDLKSEISGDGGAQSQRGGGGLPPATNHHEQQIWCGARFPLLYRRSWKAGGRSRYQQARRLELEGLLAVEMFVTQGDGLFCE